MTTPTVVSEEAIDIYEVKKELKIIEKREEELGFRAGKTKEYITEISQMPDKKASEIRKEIIALEIPRIKKEHIAKIIDVNPVSVADLKQLMSGFNITVKDDSLKKIFAILSK